MKRIALVVSAVLALVPGSVAAQIVWDAPAMIRPGAPSGLTVLLLEPYPGNELGALAIWRQGQAPTGLGIRAGVAEDASGDLAAMFGVDVSGALSTSQARSEPGVIWWGGAGLGVGDELIATFPLGISLGWSLPADEGVVFHPHLGGHMALDIITGPGDELDLDGSFDLGMDLGFRSGLMIRFGASIGGREALGVGLRLPS